jgi:hypothetical protein
LTSLVKKMDQKVKEATGKYAEGRSLGAYLIVNDTAGLADQLRDMAKTEGLQRVSLCIGAAPPRYEVANEADLTVVIYNPGRRNQQSVVANFALRRGELDDATSDTIVAALSKVLPK